MIFRFASPWFLGLLAFPWLWLVIRTVKRVFKPGISKGRICPSRGLPERRTPGWRQGCGPPGDAGADRIQASSPVQGSGPKSHDPGPGPAQAGEKKLKVMTEGVNIVLALDLSESMSALDFKQEDKIVNRLEAVKGVVAEFILNREGDRIGMVVFGSNAFTQLPLTRDYNTISFMLSHLKIGAAGPSTAIGDAIGISLKRLADVKAKSNIIILLTDGKSNAGSLSWQDAADLAKRRGVKIYTVGVGSKGQAPFLVNGLFGQQYVYRQVDVDWQALETIAKTTGGQFFRAGDTKGLARVYKTIDAMEKTTVEVDKWVDYQEMFARFLIAGLIIYLVCLVLSRTWLLRIPES